MSDYANNLKNDKFLNAYDKEKNGPEEQAFLRVFTTTSLFQRLKCKDKFREDEMEIKLFKKFAMQARKSDKITLEKFSDVVKPPIYDCMPFFDIAQISRDNYEIQKNPKLAQRNVAHWA